MDYEVHHVGYIGPVIADDVIDAQKYQLGEELIRYGPGIADENDAGMRKVHPNLLHQIKNRHAAFQVLVKEKDIGRRFCQ